MATHLSRRRWPPTYLPTICLKGDGHLTTYFGEINIFVYLAIFGEMATHLFIYDGDGHLCTHLGKDCNQPTHSGGIHLFSCLPINGRAATYLRGYGHPPIYLWKGLPPTCSSKEELQPIYLWEESIYLSAYLFTEGWPPNYLSWEGLPPKLFIWRSLSTHLPIFLSTDLPI